MPVKREYKISCFLLVQIASLYLIFLIQKEYMITESDTLNSRYIYDPEIPTDKHIYLQLLIAIHAYFAFSFPFALCIIAVAFSIRNLVILLYIVCQCLHRFIMRKSAKQFRVVNYNANDAIPEDETCSICLDYIKARNNPEDQQKIVKLNCSCIHMFHKPCIQEWLKVHPACPSCRKTFPYL